MSIRVRAAVGYVAAVAIPLALSLAWDYLSPVLQVVPAVIFLLFVALTARLCGFRPAILFVATSSGLLWLHVFRFVTTEPSLLLLRLGLYLMAAITIASISRQKSEEVREAEERYRALVELSPDGIGVADENATIVFANSALARLVGAADRTELIGRKTLEFADPEYVDLAKQRFQQLAEGREAQWITTKWVKLDGTRLDVETAGVPVHHGGRVLFQGFVRDVTERKKAEARLEENRRRLQALFDTALDAIVFFDSNGRAIDANPAASTLLGVSRDELLQSNVGDFFVGAIDIVGDVLASGKARGEGTIRRKDGSSRETEYRAVANVLPDLHVATIHDITARKEAERSLEQLSGRLLRLQDEERRRIARQLHDTTAQSLAAVRLNLSRISRSASGTDPAIKESLDESIALTEQSIAEIRTLSYLLHPPMIEEIGLISSLRWYVRGFEERSGIRVTLDVPDDLDRLSSDLETVVFRIVQEALTNIQRHSGSSVAGIRLSKEADSVSLEIEDHGRGMPVHLRGRDADAAASGVGIAGIRQRVKQLGGQMEIRSADHGTKIVVQLPVSAR